MREDFESIKYTGKNQKARCKTTQKKGELLEVASYDTPWWPRWSLFTSRNPHEIAGDNAGRNIQKQAERVNHENRNSLQTTHSLAVQSGV